jgi:hypothetical protein
MQIPDPYIFEIVVAVVSSVATLIASRVASKASKASATTALDGVSRQIEFQTRAKIAEFRQAWINELRTQMSTLQSIGVTPDVDHSRDRNFYMAGTMIELRVCQDILKTEWDVLKGDLARVPPSSEA